MPLIVTEVVSAGATGDIGSAGCGNTDRHGAYVAPPTRHRLQEYRVRGAAEAEQREMRPGKGREQVRGRSGAGDSAG